MMNHHEFRTIGSIIAIIGIIGMTTNFIVLFVFCKKRALINPANVFIISLTISNLAVSVAGNPFSASSNLAERWLYGEAVCVWYGFANTFFGLVSISTLTTIAIHRYLIICKTNIGISVTTKVAILMSIGAWLYAFFWATLPVIGWAKYSHEGPGTWCSIKWDEGGVSSISYIICMFIFSFFLPILTMVIMYANIFMEVHSMTKATNHEQMHRISLRRERRLAKTSLAIWFSFLVAWTPYAVVSITSLFGYSNLLGNWGAAIPAVFAKTATIYNPFIYAGMNNAFQIAMVEIFPCLSHFIKPNNDTSMNSNSNAPGVTRDGSLIQVNKVKPREISQNLTENTKA